MLHGQSTAQVRKLVELLEGEIKEQQEVPATAPARERNLNPFGPLREELQELQSWKPRFGGRAAHSAW